MGKRGARDYLEPFVYFCKEPPVEFMPVIRNVRIIFPFDNDEEVLIDQALVDTGADYSVLPKTQYEFLILDTRYPKTSCAIQDSSGRTSDEAMVPVKYLLPNVMNSWKELDILIFGTEFLIGRDILCNFIVNLDGPARELRITRKARVG